jgi:predicted transcriptional regulator
MPTVDTIMTRDLLRVEAGTALAEAARAMDARRVGAALVFEDDRLVGIVTERDVLRAVARDGLGATVADWMTHHPETIEASDSTGHAAAIMIHGGFRHLPVADGDRIVGIISIRDLMRVVLDDQAPRGA